MGKGNLKRDELGFWLVPGDRKKTRFYDTSEAFYHMDELKKKKK